MQSKIIKKSLSIKIAFNFLICSIFFAIIGAVVHTFIEHGDYFNYTDLHRKHIEDGRGALIARAVAGNNIKLLQEHIQGISSMIYAIEYIAVFDNETVLVSNGINVEALEICNISLVYDGEEVGIMSIGFNLNKIKFRLLEDFWRMLIIQVILNSLLSILIFGYVRRHIVKPLNVIAKNVETTDLFVDKVDLLDDFVCRGDEIGCVANAINIVQAKIYNSLNELHKSKDHNRILIDNVPVAALVIENEKIVFCNKSSLELFSIDDCKLLIGTKFSDYVDQSSKRIIESCHTKSISAIDCKKCIEKDCKKVKKIFSVVMYDTQGVQKYVELVFVKNNDCMEGTSLVFLKDMTQSVILQREKDVLNQRITQTQKMEALGTLAGGISHDFNNILTGILGYSELIKFRTQESGTKKDIGYVIDAGYRSKALIEQLLVFCRSDSNNKESSIRLDVVLNEVLKLLQSTVPPTIEFKSFISAVQSVKVNETQIHQVMMNLCTNAVHAIQHNSPDAIGEIVIDLSDVYLTDDDVKLLPKLSAGDFVKLTVADDGCGMSQGVIDRIFEPCFTTKPIKRGTGMGLSVVYGIIDNYNGCIIVDSKLGEGTQFVIYLPTTKDSSIISDTDRNIAIVQGEGNILIVDDEKMIVNVLKSFLEEIGYNVHIESSPIAAIEYFSKHHNDVDCVVTDLMMPGMTGVTMTQLLQEIDPSALIIWCTGFLSHKSQMDADALGIVEILHKPVDGYIVAEAIHKHLK